MTDSTNSENNPLIVQSTLDVPAKPLEGFCEELRSEFSITEPVQSRIGLFSAAPPSWINLIANAAWWQQLLGVAATAFIVEIAREAAKDTWKSKAKVFAATVGAGNSVVKFVARLAGLRQGVPQKTAYSIAIPEPDDYFAARLVLTHTDTDMMMVEIALFVFHLEELLKVVDRNKLQKGVPEIGYHLRIAENGDLHVTWHDPNSGQRVDETIPLIRPSSVDVSDTK